MDRDIQLPMNVDFAAVRRKLGLEHGPAVQSETGISGVLADIDEDLEDCEAEVTSTPVRDPLPATVPLDFSTKSASVGNNTSCACNLSYCRLFANSPTKTFFAFFTCACGSILVTSSRRKFCVLCLGWHSVVYVRTGILQSIHWHDTPRNSTKTLLIPDYRRLSRIFTASSALAGYPGLGVMQAHNLACAALVGNPGAARRIWEIR